MWAMCTDRQYSTVQYRDILYIEKLQSDILTLIHTNKLLLPLCSMYHSVIVVISMCCEIVYLIFQILLVVNTRSPDHHLYKSNVTSSSYVPLWENSFFPSYNYWVNEWWMFTRSEANQVLRCWRHSQIKLNLIRWRLRKCKVKSSYLYQHNNISFT